MWLSLVVEFMGDKPELLPNLDYKIEAGDSLIASDPGEGEWELFRKQYIRECDDLNLTSGEREAVYEAVINLVTKRLQKAGSV